MKNFVLFAIIALMASLTSCNDETDSMWELDKPEGWSEQTHESERMMRPSEGDDGVTFVYERMQGIDHKYFMDTDFKQMLSDELFEKEGVEVTSPIEAGSDNFLNYKYQREFITPDGKKGIRAVGFADDKMVFVEGFATEATYQEMMEAVNSLRLAGGVSPHDYFMKNFNTFWIVVMIILTIFDGMFVCESIKMRRKRPKDREYYTRAIKIGCIIFAVFMAIFAMILWPCPQLLWKYLLAEGIIFGAFVAFGLTIFMTTFVEKLMGQLTD